MDIEKEIKILVTLEEYKKIERLFNWSNDYIQVNHYYGDTKDINFSTDTYRVREKKGKKVLQVKISVKNEGALHIKKEYEKELYSVPPKLKKSELMDLVGGEFDDKDYIGKLITRRKECLDFCDIIICLDANTYLDTNDYEVEIEFKGKRPDYIIEMFNNNGITIDPQIEGKYTRFLKRLKDYRGNI